LGFPTALVYVLDYNFGPHSGIYLWLQKAKERI
jgi:hypothetical protein